MIGSPSTGKTHIAFGLGIEACLEGYKESFSSVTLLVNQLKESRSEQTLRSFEMKFKKYDLFIIDVLGTFHLITRVQSYFSLILSLRAGRIAAIITSNLSYERWEEVFHNQIGLGASLNADSLRFLINLVEK